MTDPKTWALAVAALTRRIEPKDLRRGSRRIGEGIEYQLKGIPADHDALDLARTISVAADASAAGLLEESKAWDMIFDTARKAQRRFTSWRELGEDYAHGWDGMTDGRGGAVDVDAPFGAGGAWANLPWEIDLTPIPQVACPSCRAPRDRPSQHAYVYCDRCATLVEYDLLEAVREPMAPPDARYVAARGELAFALEAARTEGQRETYRELELGLHKTWVDTVRKELSIRIWDSEYRTRYVAWLADVATAMAFDAEARSLELALQATIAGLAFGASERGPRVTAGFPALRDAALAYYARRDALIAPLLDRHPDAPSRELQGRINRAALVRGWIRFLEPAEAEDLVERAGLSRDYAPVTAPAMREAHCSNCREGFPVVADARRVVCDECGCLTRA